MSYLGDPLLGDPWLLDFPLTNDDSLCQPLQPSPPTQIKHTSLKDDLYVSQRLDEFENPYLLPVAFSQSVQHDTSGIAMDPLLSASAAIGVSAAGVSSRNAPSIKEVSRMSLNPQTVTSSAEEESRRCSTRTKTLTDKGYQYQKERSLQVFKSALSNHKRHVTLCEKLLKEGSFDVTILTNSRNHLEKSIVALSDAFHKVVEIDPQMYVQFIDIVNERETINLQTLHDITRCLRYIDTEHITTFSQTSKISKSKSKSSHSKSSNSSRSHSSATVMRAEAIANAAALKTHLKYFNEETEQKVRLEKLTMMKRLAVEEAKIAALDRASQKGSSNNGIDMLIQTSNLESIPNVDCVVDNLLIQTANNENYPIVNHGVPNIQTVDCGINSNVVHGTSSIVKQQINSSVVQGVKDTVRTQTLPNPCNSVSSCHNTSMRINPQAMFHTFSLDRAHSDHIGVKKHSTVCCNFQSAVQSHGIPVTQTDTMVSPIEICNHENMSVPVCNSNLNKDAPSFIPSTVQVPNVANTGQSGDGVFYKTLSDLMYMNRMPLPEPGVFTGEYLKYPAWKNTFLALVRNVDPSERVYLLKKYIGGDALNCVAGILMVDTPDSYEEAMSVIDRRYGDKFTIACAFKSKIEDWPKIQNRDPLALRNFSDFLKQCEVAARHNPSLRVLDDDIHNRTMLQKLPD